MGFRVFDLLRLAVEAELENGRLVSDEATVSSKWAERRFQSPKRASSRTSSPPQLDRSQLTAQIVRWNDELMPSLLTAWDRQPLVDALGDRLAKLADGCSTFRFGDLIEPMKQDLRARWLALGFSEPKSLGISGSVGEIDGWETLESREGFNALTQCVEKRVSGLEARTKTKDYLSLLWSFLCRWAWPSEIRDDTLPKLMPKASTAAEGEELPSNRRLGELLDIPRNRIAQLKTQLGRLLAACRGSQTNSAFAAPADHRVGSFQERSARALSLTLGWAELVREELSQSAPKGFGRLLRSTAKQPPSEAVPGGLPPSQETPMPSSTWRLGAWGTLTAGLAITVIGLASWIATLQRDLTQSRGPRILQTETAEDLRIFTADRSATLQRIPGADYALLYLDLQGIESFPKYRVTLLAPDDTATAKRTDQLQAIWSSEPVAARRELMLYLPLTLADRPGLRIQFLGVASGEDRPIAELPLEWLSE